MTDTPDSDYANQNVFLIDWLTVTFHDQTVSNVKHLLGLDGADIPWQERRAFAHGYPVTTYWDHIAIRWGADDEKFYTDDPDKKAADKVRYDMGICLDMSGQGCRAFEQYGAGDWLKLLQAICDHAGKINVTRLDLAYDDHIGLLDIYRIERDRQDRNFVCKARKTSAVHSDDLDDDIQGLTVEMGTKKSKVMLRIYNKAAERGYDHTKHWIRVELQLRDDRALAAVAEILKEQNIGYTTSGIIRNYCTFRTPSADTNKCRWPIADYWENILMNMEKIRIVITPGEPYNYRKTEEHMLNQYGQAFIAYYRMHGEVNSFLRECMKRFPQLKPKYEATIADFKLIQAEQKRRLKEAREFYGFPLLDDDDPSCQVDFVEMFGLDPNE